jgi:hypothetical protein
MSAIKVIDEIREKGGKMLCLSLFCGGLVAPESDTNLGIINLLGHHNVVLAGQEVLQQNSFRRNL